MNKFLILFFLLFLACPIFVSAEQIDINSATLPQLDELTGIGPAYAQRIIDGRPYSSVDDLLRVKGIGPATLQKIKDQGLAYVTTQGSLPPATKETAQLEIETATESITATNEPINLAEIGSPLIYPKGIVLNEILPSPEGADEIEEWVEIFNQNNFEVDLSGWKIKDASGSIITYIFPKNTKIAGQGYLVLKRTETKIALNNTEDELFFLTPDEKIVSSLAYKGAPRNQSYSRVNDDWKWSSSLTPGSKNIVSQGPQKNSNNLSISEKSDINKIEIKDLTASLSQESNQKETKSTSPWFLFLTALAITIISAAIILFIKFKFIKHET